MSRRRRPELLAEAARRNQEQLAQLGAELRRSRLRRRLKQAQLAAAIGVVQSTVSVMERGRGGSLSMDLWQTAFTAMDRELRFEPSRDASEEVADAGHLMIQDLVLRLGREAGFVATFELPSRPADPSRSTDVGLRDDRRRLLVLAECWNSIGDIGAAARSTSRKIADAEAFAAFAWGERPHRVASVWVIRASRRNRELVARYPDVFAARFPGSSSGWVAALTRGDEPPRESGLVWCDVAATRVFAWRRRAIANRSRIEGGE
jgi:transcriptional regulator with XRE-family HTH domain